MVFRTSHRALCALIVWFGFATGTAHAAGTLTPVGSGDQPLRIVDHHVEVLIDSGYARTEVTQTFENPNMTATSALYTLPLPDSAALSEMTVVTADQTLYGEVVDSAQAQSIYTQQVSSGGQAGLAVKQGYQRFAFHIASVPAGQQATLTFAYYQALEIDAGIARYLYPLEEGGTDGGADQFWTRNDMVDGSFSANVRLRSAFPIADVHVPGFDDIALVTQAAEGDVSISLSAMQNLDRDFIVYYRLADNLPGRVEVVPYRGGGEDAGTFMMTFTPGVDLAPLDHGADYVFVLDVSGSMASKLSTLQAAVAGALRALQPGDRVRVVKFSDSAAELTAGWVAAGKDGEQNAIDGVAAAVQQLQIEGGTNLYAGLSLALQGLDADRATAVMLVTDGVANEGLVDGPSFSKLLAEKDVRMHGFLLGNSANWPLLQLLTETSGGFYQPLSNQDDIAGQLLLVRNKLTHEALQDFTVTIDGGKTHDVTHTQRKVHRGEQVAIFGRYDEPGDVKFSVDATITGKKQHYEGKFTLPEKDEQSPELERLWAYAQVHWLEYQRDMQLTDASAVSTTIGKLGIDYQLVTDETSMILLDDADFARFGIDPTNRDRSRREQEARMLRTAGAPVDHSVAVDPAFAGTSGTSLQPGSSGSPAGTSSGSGAHYSSGNASGGGDSGFGGGALGEGDACALVLLAWAARKLGRSRRWVQR
jgi:Ca-activated chloride channel family protein